MFTDRIALMVADKAKAAGLVEPNVLAITQVETNGNFLEPDGRTPTFRFEHFTFFIQLRQHAPGKLAQAERAGLAINHLDIGYTSRAQRTPAMRMAVLTAARAIDEELANASTSWGGGQVMGFNCKECGFETATEMVDAMTDGGVGSQIDVMITLLKNFGLVDAINKWMPRTIARKWNGASFAQNHYDTNLDAAKRIWDRKLPQLRDNLGVARIAPPEQLLSPAQIKAVQVRYRQLGFTEVGEPGGGWDTKTTGATAAFQAYAGLPQTGHYDAETAKVLFDPTTKPRIPATARADVSIDDLREKGSRTIDHADHVDLWGRCKLAGGTFFGLGAGAHKIGLIDQAQSLASEGSSVKALADSFQDLFSWAATTQGLMVIALLVGGGIFLMLMSNKIRGFRLADHQSGVHAGPVAEVDAEGGE